MRAVPALLGAAVLFAPAAPASGSPGDGGDDTGFLATVRDSGVTYSSPDRAIAFGRAVCGWLGSGTPGPDLVTNLQNSNPGLTTDHASLFVAISVKYYCPQQLTGSP